MSKLLELKNISKKYNTINGEIEAIKNISLEIKSGDFIVIVGTSGCGKSTLLSIIANLDKPSSGDIIYHMDKPIIGYMLQEDALFEHMRIKDNILLGLKIKKTKDAKAVDYANSLLKKYNLKSFINKRPSELSGGMKQRVLCFL